MLTYRGIFKYYNEYRYSEVLFTSLIFPLLWYYFSIYRNFIIGYIVTICWFLSVDYLYTLLFMFLLNVRYKQIYIKTYRSKSPRRSFY